MIWRLHFAVFPSSLSSPLSQRQVLSRNGNCFFNAADILLLISSWTPSVCNGPIESMECAFSLSFHLVVKYISLTFYAWRFQLKLASYACLRQPCSYNQVQKFLVRWILCFSGVFMVHHLHPLLPHQNCHSYEIQLKTRVTFFFNAGECVCMFHLTDLSPAVFQLAHCSPCTYLSFCHSRIFRFESLICQTAR